jgi:hypothetical protein
MENLELIFPYTATELTEQVNVVPNLYGLLNELNLFPSFGSRSRLVEIRYENGVLRVLPAKERGAAPTPALARTGSTIFVEIPHFPAVDLITPTDIQDILIQVGETKRLITAQEEVGKRLNDIRNGHAITREWVRSTALQGTITDGNSQTIYNLYTVFGISPNTLAMALGTSTTDVNAKCASIWQTITQNLKGETMNGIEAIVDPQFFEELIAHPNVAQFWLNAEQALQLANIVRKDSAGNMWGREFFFGRIRWREYYGQAPIKTSPTASLSTAPFWAAQTGTAFPVGTKNMFATYDGPANDIRFANTRGQELYVSPKFLDHGEGIELKSESNCLAINKRPAAVVQLTTN